MPDVDTETPAAGKTEPVEQVDADAVAAALARLVNSDADSSAAVREPYSAVDLETSAQTIAAAETALEHLPTAASFVDEGGEQRLRRAVATARERDEGLAARGCAALRTLDTFRTAATTGTQSEPSPAQPPPDNHFHRGRTTLLKGAGVAPDR